MNNISILNLPFPAINNFSLRVRFNLKFLLIFSSILIFLLFSFYIFQNNSLISGNYQIKKSQEKINELTIENENLEIQLTGLNSLTSIENLISNSNFEKIDKIHYIQIVDNQIVKE